MRSECRSISLDNRRSDSRIGASSPLKAFPDSHDGDEDDNDDDDDCDGDHHDLSLEPFEGLRHHHNNHDDDAGGDADDDDCDDDVDDNEWEGKKREIMKTS